MWGVLHLSINKRMMWVFVHFFTYFTEEEEMGMRYGCGAYGGSPSYPNDEDEPDDDDNREEQVQEVQHHEAGEPGSLIKEFVVGQLLPLGIAAVVVGIIICLLYWAGIFS